MPSYEMFDPEQEEKSVGGSGAWLQFGDGDEATLTFIGKTYSRETIWLGSHGATLDRTNPEHVKWLETPGKDGKLPTPAVKISGNVVMKHEDGHQPPYSVKILELAPKHWRRIIKRVKKFGVDKWYTVERTGSKAQDTEYDVDPGENLSAEDKAAFAELKFYNLEEFYAKKRDANGDDSFNYGANAE